MHTASPEIATTDKSFSLASILAAPKPTSREETPNNYYCSSSDSSSVSRRPSLPGVTLFSTNSLFHDFEHRRMKLPRPPREGGQPQNYPQQQPQQLQQQVQQQYLPQQPHRLNQFTMPQQPQHTVHPVMQQQPPVHHQGQYHSHGRTTDLNSVPEAAGSASKTHNMSEEDWKSVMPPVDDEDESDPRRIYSCPRPGCDKVFHCYY